MTARLTELIDLYLQESITDPQREELANLLEEADHADQAKKIIYNFLENKQFNYHPDLADLYKRIETKVSEEPVKIHFIKRFRWMAAAAVLLFAIPATYFFVAENKKKPTTFSQVQRYKNDIVPGRKGALIKLADGKIIDVNAASTGLIAMQGTLKIIKDANGQIRYEGKPEPGIILFNEVITQGGEEQTVTLPDHSTVILNAGSSLKYPLEFSLNERLVSMTGEAFFKVVHNEATPFRVSVNGHTIEDIGTQFNVNAYEDEVAMKTTLVEGSVKMGNTVLKAGQQATVAKGTNTLKVIPVDTDLATAWIRGLFSYDDADLQTVLRQVGRWYRVNISYQKGAPSPHFWGDMQRDATLVSVLKVLEKSGVRFSVEGNQVTVMAN